MAPVSLYHKPSKAAFEQAVIERVKRIRIGDPMQAETNFGPLVSFPHMEKSCLILSRANNKVRLYWLVDNVPLKQHLLTAHMYTDRVHRLSWRHAHCARWNLWSCLSILLWQYWRSYSTCQQDQLWFSCGCGNTRYSQAHRIIHQLEGWYLLDQYMGRIPAEMPVGGYKTVRVGRENGITTLEHYTRIKSSSLLNWANTKVFLKSEF